MSPRKWLRIYYPLVVAVVLYLPLIFMGYGADVDAYRVLDAGRNFMQTGDYVPSRNPGYVLYESMMWLLNQMGGSVATNLGSLLAAVLCLYCFVNICRYFGLADGGLLGLLLAVHPAFWVNAASTMDYVWSTAFLMAGLWLGLQPRKWGSGLALGLATAARLSAAVPAMGIWLYLFFKQKQQRGGIVAAALLWGVISVSAYLLPADFKGWNLQFLTASTGAAELWTPWMRLGRFAYKNIYFWGLPAALFLAGCLSMTAGRQVREMRRNPNHPLTGLALLCAGVIAGSELIFLRFPIEPDYLLPTLPFWLLLAGIALKPLKQGRGALVIFLILLLLGNFVNINLAQPNQAGQASAAEFGVWVEEGRLVGDIRQRMALMGCDSRDCYAQVILGEE